MACEGAQAPARVCRQILTSGSIAIAASSIEKKRIESRSLEGYIGSALAGQTMTHAAGKSCSGT